MKKLRINRILASCLCLNSFIILLIILLLNHLPPVVPLYYGKPQGEEVLAQKLYLLLPPSFSIIFIILNTLIIQFFHDKFLKNVLIGICIVTSLFSTITIVKIILLVGS